MNRTAKRFEAEAGNRRVGPGLYDVRHGRIGTSSSFHATLRQRLPTFIDHANVRGKATPSVHDLWPRRRASSRHRCGVFLRAARWNSTTGGNRRVGPGRYALVTEADAVEELRPYKVLRACDRVNNRSSTAIMRDLLLSLDLSPPRERLEVKEKIAKKFAKKKKEQDCSGSSVPIRSLEETLFESMRVIRQKSGRDSVAAAYPHAEQLRRHVM